MVIRCSVETRKLLDKLLRVDHAKGLAAKYMYKGQLAVLNAGHASSAIEVGSFFSFIVGQKLRIVRYLLQFNNLAESCT